VDVYRTNVRPIKISNVQISGPDENIQNWILISGFQGLGKAYLSDKLEIWGFKIPNKWINCRPGHTREYIAVKQYCERVVLVLSTH